MLLLRTVDQVDSDKVKIEDRPFSLARDLCFLEEAVARTHAALVILDSLDTCRPNALRQALPALAQLAQRTGSAILLVRPIAPHPPAAAPKSGSLELLRVVRSSLLIQSDPEDKQRQRLLVVTKHALCEQPGILSFQLTAPQGILTLDWLGAYAHPLPPDEDSYLLSFRNASLLRQAILRTLEECAAPMNARSLTTITGFRYENVRKLLQRMVHAQQPSPVTPAWRSNPPRPSAPLRQIPLSQLSQVSQLSHSLRRLKQAHQNLLSQLSHLSQVSSSLLRLKQPHQTPLSQLSHLSQVTRALRRSPHPNMMQPTTPHNHPSPP